MAYSIPWYEKLMGISGIRLKLNPFAICIKVANETGGTLAAGTPVYFSGWSTTYKAVKVAEADCDSPTTLADAVISDSLSNNTTGNAVLIGVIQKLNTNSYSAVGDPAYLSDTVGTMQIAAPTGADQVVQTVGRVKVKSATIGEMFVFPILKVISKVGSSFLQALAVSQAKMDATAKSQHVWADTADGTIEAYRLTELDASGDLIAATANSPRVVGANADNAQKLAAAAINLCIGKTSLNAAEPITGGAQLKAGADGKAVCLNDAQKAGGTIKTTAAGSAFANQPAGDTLTLESSDAGDTGIQVTIIGTTNGGVVTVTETKALDGTDSTTPVDSVKADWGLILGLKLNQAATGNIIVKEKSGGATIATITAGQTSLGVNAVAAADQGCHNTIPSATGSDTTTKYIGIQYITSAGATAYQTVQLNNTTPAAFSTAALRVTEVYSGDLEGTRTAVVKTSATEDDENLKIGRALAAAATAADFAALVTP